MESVLINIFQFFALLGFFTFFVGLLAKEGVRQAAGDYWTSISDLKWGEFVKNDAQSVLNFVKYYIGHPSDYQFYRNIFIVSILLNMLILSLLFLFNFNTSVTLNKKNTIALFVYGVLLPGFFFDLISMLSTFFLIYLVAMFSNGKVVRDGCLYIIFLILDLFILMACVSSSGFIYEVMQHSLGKLQYPYFNAPDFHSFLFFSLMGKSFVSFLK